MRIWWVGGFRPKALRVGVGLSGLETKDYPVGTRRGAFGRVAERPIDASPEQCPPRAVSAGFSPVLRSPRRGGGPGAAAPAAQGPRGRPRCP